MGDNISPENEAERESSSSMSDQMISDSSDAPLHVKVNEIVGISGQFGRHILDAFLMNLHLTLTIALYSPAI